MQQEADHGMSLMNLSSIFGPDPVISYSTSLRKKNQWLSFRSYIREGGILTRSQVNLSKSIVL